MSWYNNNNSIQSHSKECYRPTGLLGDSVWVWKVHVCMKVQFQRGVRAKEECSKKSQKVHGSRMWSGPHYRTFIQVTIVWILRSNQVIGAVFRKQIPFFFSFFFLRNHDLFGKPNSTFGAFQVLMDNALWSCYERICKINFFEFQIQLIVHVAIALLSCAGYPTNLFWWQCV